MTWMNILFGLGLVAAGMGNFAIDAFLGLWACTVSVGGIISAIRNRIGVTINIGLLAIVGFLGGQIFLAWWDPQMFSVWTVLFTILYLAGAALALWMLGGWYLDVAIAASAIPEAEFDHLVHSLETTLNTGVANQNRPAWYHIIERRIFWVREHAPYLSGPMTMLLQSLRAFSINVFKFLRFLFMVAVLIGMYFAINPPSNSWRMFWMVALGFVGYALSGRKFNWKLWNEVSILFMVTFMILGFTAPIWRSWLVPLHNWVFRPAASMYATTKDKTLLAPAGWRGTVHSWGANFWVFSERNADSNTWLLLTDSTPTFNEDLGLYTVKVRVARDNNAVTKGFDKAEYEIVSDLVERQSFLNGGPSFSMLSSLGSLFGAGDTSYQGNLNTIIFSVIALFVIGAIAGVLGLRVKAASTNTPHHG